MRLFRFALWPAGAALGILAEQIYFGWGDARHWVPDLVTGWSLIACGLVGWPRRTSPHAIRLPLRTEEHTSELQSHSELVCRLLLEKKKKKNRRCRRNVLADSRRTS